LAGNQCSRRQQSQDQYGNLELFLHATKASNKWYRLVGPLGVVFAVPLFWISYDQAQRSIQPDPAIAGSKDARIPLALRGLAR
jgi:hypothetical protein